MKKVLKIKIGTVLFASIFLSIFFVLSFTVLRAQENKISLNKLMSDIQRVSENSKEISMTFWLPKEFWEISLADDPSISSQQINEFIRILEPYTIIIAIQGDIGKIGGVTYESESVIRNSIRLKDSFGNNYSPLDDNKIDSDTKNLLSMLRPVLANLLGPMGQNMHFFLFPAENKKGERIVDAKSEGKFFLKLANNEFEWRLPLGSLLPQKTCSMCGEKLNGAFRFCPYCGTQL